MEGWCWGSSRDAATPLRTETQGRCDRGLLTTHGAPPSLRALSEATRSPAGPSQGSGRLPFPLLFRTPPPNLAHQRQGPRAHLIRHRQLVLMEGSGERLPRWEVLKPQHKIEFNCTADNKLGI